MAHIENPGALAGASGAEVPCYAIAAGAPKLAPDGLCDKIAPLEASYSETLPIAVQYVRRLTGAGASTARLYAELSGLLRVGENGSV